MTDHPRLPSAARDLIRGADTEVYFSVVSLWEIGVKAGLGRLPFLPSTVAMALEESGFIRLGIEVEHLDRVASLPLFHRDPFDRLLVAQAEVEPLILVTSDRALATYGPAVLVTPP
jgi:PIN domain nuclease of toxin-antitoxin system